jgi:hypothetical protein
MRLLFGTPVIGGPPGRHTGVLNGVGVDMLARSVSHILCLCKRGDQGSLLAFALSDVRASDGLLQVVYSPSERLPETVWTKGARVFLGPRPLQLAGVALTSTGQLQAVFACAQLCRPVHLRVDQATLSATDIHIPSTTLPAPLMPTTRDDADVAAPVDAVAFSSRQIRSRRYDVCAS